MMATALLTSRQAINCRCSSRDSLYTSDQPHQSRRPLAGWGPIGDGARMLELDRALVPFRSSLEPDACRSPPLVGQSQTIVLFTHHESKEGKSDIRKICRVLAFAALIFIAFVTLSPPLLRPGTGNVLMERWAAFALFGTLLGLGYPKAGWRSMLFALIVVFGLEALQEFVPGRHGRIEDAFVKSIGAIVGIGLAAAINLFLKPRTR